MLGQIGPTHTATTMLEPEVPAIYFIRAEDLFQITSNLFGGLDVFIDDNYLVLSDTEVLMKCLNQTHTFSLVIQEFELYF